MRFALALAATILLAGCATVGDAVREATGDEVNPVGLYVAWTHDKGSQKGVVSDGWDADRLRGDSTSNGVEVGVTFSLESKEK